MHVLLPLNISKTHLCLLWGSGSLHSALYNLSVVCLPMLQYVTPSASTHSFDSICMLRSNTTFVMQIRIQKHKPSPACFCRLLEGGVQQQPGCSTGFTTCTPWLQGACAHGEVQGILTM